MRSNALKRIRSNLINVPAVAFHPDHPLLLTGPDVLVGSEGLLFAFFVPTAHEFAHPNDLLARLTACRLVLPGHTFCAAVLDTETFSSELEHDFDKVIDKTDIARLIEHKEKRPSRTTNELAQIRSVAYGRAAIIFKEAIDIPRKTYARPTE